MLSKFKRQKKSSGQKQNKKNHRQKKTHFFNKKRANNNRTNKIANKILRRARQEAKQLLLDTKSQILDLQTKSEAEYNQQLQASLTKSEELGQQQSQVDELETQNQTKAEHLKSRKKAFDSVVATYEQDKQELLDQLLKQAGQTQDETEKELFDQLDKRLEYQQITDLQLYENQLNQETDILMQELLSTVLPKGAIDFQADYNSPIVEVNSPKVVDEIRGANDCNKDFFEKLLEVELLFDDQGTIRINAHDSGQRELARRVLNKLVKDRRINPARIRRLYHQHQNHMQAEMKAAGKKLCQAVGVFNLPDEIVETLGKFLFRYSYGQNMIEHTMEETLIGIALANEFKVDANVVRLGCLFHDIGKVIYDDEGTHVETGVAYLKQHNMPQEVIDCVAQSHEDEPFSSIESIIVHIADGISGARPAARHNDHEFTNRIKYLEQTPREWPGVKDAYAIQAGREVRVVVDPRQVKDEDLTAMAEEIRDRIKAELSYPGSVTVNVIRAMIKNTQVKFDQDQQKSSKN